LTLQPWVSLGLLDNQSPLFVQSKRAGPSRHSVKSTRNRIV
jgi:hypothetical protein